MEENRNNESQRRKKNREGVEIARKKRMKK